MTQIPDSPGSTPDLTWPQNYFILIKKEVTENPSGRFKNT